MQEIPLRFNIKDYHYKQVWRDSHYAIYEQILAGEFMYFEVFKIPVRKEEVCFGQKLVEREVLPHSEQWGKKAFTVKTIEEAREYIQEMMENEKDRVKKPLSVTN